MAGTVAIELPTTMEGHTLTHRGDSPSPKKKGSPEKPKSPDMLKQGSGETKTSPQGKGVGLFGLEGSPTVNGQVEDPAKDPKVRGASWQVANNF